MSDTSTEAPAPAAPPSRVRAALKFVSGSVGIAFEPFFGFIKAVGDHSILFAQSVFWLFRRPFRARLFVEAMEYHGIGSLPIVTLVGLFTGMVTALQSVNAFRILKAESFAGSAVGLALAVELAPVLTSLMLAGRVGAGIATELGTMRITEQIDALESMAVSPIQYLVAPRLVAGFFMTPILSLVFFIVGMGGAYLVAVIIMGVDHGGFVENFKWYVDPVHVVQGVIKSAFFGLAISLIGCQQGYNASGGGRGVGMATTRAVVIGSVTVIALDYFLSDILLAILPTTGAQ